MIRRKGVTKGDMVRAIKELHFELQQVTRHLIMIDGIVDNYIHMNKDEKKLKKFMTEMVKEQQKKKDEHKQEQRKSSGRSTKTSK
tara:strand:- start:28 stop:282 length:255 start_codon:yes stop_codon:yes gene_type:complete